MIKQSRVSPKGWVSKFTGAALLVGSMGAFADTAITFGDEDIIGGTFAYQVSGGVAVTTFNVSAPFVCGNVGTPAAAYANKKINVQVAGATPANGNFLFGGLSGGAQVPLGGLGTWNYSPATGLVIGVSDPALVCYSLSTAGTRKPTADLFLDTFEIPSPDATLATRVVQLPDPDNFLPYAYYIDVNIPASSAVTKWTIRDGFDSSVLTVGNYCDVAIGATSCPQGSTTANNVDVTFDLPANTAYARRFIVRRLLKSGVTVLPSGRPVALAAVFGQIGMEDRLDNNVSAGFGSLSDFDPVVNTTSTNLGGLSEGGILPNVTFSLSDDTTESTGSLLDASVMIDFNGTQVPATTNCGSTSPNPGPGSSRTCSFDIVPPGPNFATDVNPGTYASGVYANVVITATDPRGHVTTKSLQLHVASSDNDAPVFTLSNTIAPPDAGNGNMQTIICNRATGSNAPSCTGNLPGFVSGLAAGPVDAVDERAAQIAFVLVASCNVESGTPFATGNPSLTVESGGTYKLNYQLNLSATASAVCAVGAGEYLNSSYPPGQGYNEHYDAFRIVIL